MTTTVTGAFKEGIRDVEHDLGVSVGSHSDLTSQHWLDGPPSRIVPGGKGATSIKTPHEILDRCERLAVDPGPLLYASRMAAKIDNAALQDGYQLGHHAFLLYG